MSIFLPATAFSAGIATHLLWYKRYEFHVYPLRNLQAFLLAVTTIVVARIQYYDTPIKGAATSTLSLAGIFLAGIFSSVLTYRLFFNPLNKIPGPFFARISKFDSVFRNTNFDGHFQLLKLHQKYGRFVRIGPNDLSVTDPVSLNLGCRLVSLASGGRPSPRRDPAPYICRQPSLTVQSITC